MNADPRGCPFEPEILAAARNGRFSEALAAHRDACAGCGEVAAVAGFLNAAIAQQGPLQAPPEPGLIWWKAQLAAKREAAERATRPIAWVESAAWAILLLACAGIAVGQAPAFLDVVLSFRDQVAGMNAPAQSAATFLTLLVIFGVLPLAVFLSVASSLWVASPRSGRPRSRR